MKIAVNTRDILKDKTVDASAFMLEPFKVIAAQYPQHEFIFITDKPLDKTFSSLKNITSVIETEIKNTLRWQLWLNYKLPALTKKYKADILINTNGTCSLRTKIPQCIIVQDLFLQQSQSMLKKKLQFYKKQLPASLAKAKKIVSITQSAKKDILDNYKINEEKIDAVYYGANEPFKPISWKQKEDIKEKYAEGKEFFLFTGSADPINNLIPLLKAFSLFKKRQKSNMLLLIASTHSLQDDGFTASLRTYKYRNEVKLIENLKEDDLAKIMATTYAVVYPSYIERTATSILQAMKCQVPVIVTDKPFFHEICGDAGLYADPNQQECIAERMMLVFKDEKKRNELIEKGTECAKQYSWDKTAMLLWDAIIETVQH
jgi:glycosyltransferase involved in cell wall biosynthesis